jgi:hypothetical protein
VRLVVGAFGAPQCPAGSPSIWPHLWLRFIDPVAASQKAIADFFFTGAGLEQFLPVAWYRAADNVAIFNTGATDVLEFVGRLFPIDIVPLRPRGVMLQRIREALNSPSSLRWQNFTRDTSLFCA